MKTPILGLGVVLLIVGIIIAALNPSDSTVLYSGIGVLVIGLIVAGAGVAIGPKKVAMGGMGGTGGMGGKGMAMEGSMDDMVRMLASAPEGERKTMVKSRLQMFLGMPEEQRQMGIKGMITALHKLPPDQKRRMLKTRTEVIGEFAEEQRRTIMKSRMMAMKDLPDVNMTDMQGTEQVMMEVPEGPRMAFMRTMQELKESMPMM